MLLKLKNFLIKHKFYIAAGATVLFLANFPTLYGHLISTAENIFLGDAIIPFDPNVYYSYFEQVKNGYWIFTNRFTSEPLPYVIFNSFFLVVGLIMKIFSSIDNVIIYNLIKVFTGIFLLVSVNIYLKTFSQNETIKKLSFLCIVFGGGFGWIFTIIPNPLNLINPLDSWVSEAYVFFTLNLLPHITFSFALLLITLVLFFKYTQTSEKKYFYYFAIASAILATSHLYEIFTLDAIIILYSLASWRRKTIRQGLFSTVITLPFLGIALYPLLTPEYYGWGKNILLPPNLINLITSFAVYLIIFMVSQSLSKTEPLTNESKFLLVSIIAHLLLMYSPLPPARRFVSGLQIPLILLAITFLYRSYLQITNKHLAKQFLLACLILISLSSLSWVTILKTQITNLSGAEFPYFINQDLRQIITQINQLSASENDIVLTDFFLLGSFIPRYTSLRPYQGHYHQTIDIKNKIKKNYWAINTTNNKERNYFLKKERIKFVLTTTEITGDFYSAKIKQGNYFLYIVRPDL